MADCLVSFGSNMGDGPRAFALVQAALQSDPQIENLIASRLRPTRPIGSSDPQAEYLNAALRISTDLSPLELLHRLLAIEQQLGRVRTERWGPRTVDLDLLLYDRQVGRWPVSRTQELVLPHPRMSFRRFVLSPAFEIASDMFHPEAHLTIEELLLHLNTKANGIAFISAAPETDKIIGSLASKYDHARASRTDLDYSIDVVANPEWSEFPAMGSRFALVPIKTDSQWTLVRNDIKLIVYRRSEFVAQQNNWLRDRVTEFAGPRLELEHDDNRVMVREIEAGMASMLPNSVGG